MKQHLTDKYMLQLFFAATLIIVVFAIFLVYFLIVHRGKHNESFLERQRIIRDGQKALLDEQERVFNTFSMQMHDNIGQAVHHMRMHLHRVLKLSKNDEQINIIKEVAEICDQVIRDTRHISHSLNSDFIKMHGLVPLLEQELERIAKHYHINGQIVTEDSMPRLDDESTLIVYRIAQEALHNIVKHSGAKNIVIKMGHPGFGFRIAIMDDGVGFTANISPDMSGIGLTNIRDRTKLLKGHLEIKSAPGFGTTIQLTIRDLPMPEHSVESIA